MLFVFWVLWVGLGFSFAGWRWVLRDFFAGRMTVLWGWCRRGGFQPGAAGVHRGPDGSGRFGWFALFRTHPRGLGLASRAWSAEQRSANLADRPLIGGRGWLHDVMANPGLPSTARAVDLAEHRSALLGLDDLLQDEAFGARFAPKGRRAPHAMV